MIIIFYYYISLAIDFWYKSKVPYSIQFFFFFINETNSLTIMWHLSREVLPNIVWALCCNLPTSHLKGVDWLLFWPMKRFCKFFLLFFFYVFFLLFCAGSVRRNDSPSVARLICQVWVSPSASAFHNLGSIILQQPHANAQRSLLCVQLSVKSYIVKVHQELFSMWIVLSYFETSLVQFQVED